VEGGLGLEGGLALALLVQTSGVSEALKGFTQSVEMDTIKQVVHQWIAVQRLLSHALHPNCVKWSTRNCKSWPTVRFCITLQWHAIREVLI